MSQSSQSSQSTAPTTVTTANELVLEKSSNSAASGLQIDLHPLVIINISDHFTRSKVEQTNTDHATRVIGVLTGQQNGRNIEIFNSFELVLTATKLLDLEYLRKKHEQFKKVFPTYEILGWYATGSKVTQEDLAIHKQIMELNESPIFLMLDTTAATLNAKDLPIAVYESEVHIVNEQPAILFVKTTYKIQTGEAERIGVNHIAKVTPSGAEGSSLTTHLFTMQNAFSMMNIRVKILRKYLQGVKDKTIPYDHGIMRQVASLCNTLPTINNEDFNRSFLQEFNDVLLVTYLAGITKSSSILNESIDKYLVSHEKQGKRRLFM
ncbi:Mov34/MPN/PAD-1 family protein [Heterostelium album PN500]|uniref:COP9 signalosome complex subunit 6 n=1 Tax=Heterostelium pallidum (strain ATCC 26659 / Pp 5 / PN500) TaxID=670386 RepID=D3BML2_HETP5|nr:Mov34/MPN/PAD-1 family protein [Heterostelium album PN500]EFA77224.1 Mov34/MPN/PAD-1 family protein [Heterostelium album PN500]|eukprot:XP_020429353.1 Mov34/MPN/PAD-1 family protein [Heterostelium album PN500]